jgi:hypothetical protein
MLVALQNGVDGPCRIQIVHLVYVKVVVCEDLALVDVLVLVDE